MIYIFCESKKYVKILNAGPDLSQPMTEDEVIKFLTTGKRNIYLGTIDKKNEPNIHPTSYYFDPDQLKFYVESYKFSKKIENMKNNKKIYKSLLLAFPCLDIVLFRHTWGCVGVARDRGPKYGIWGGV